MRLAVDSAAKALLTPKELADAIGASESALRRWVDAGDIHMSRTAGGHRRIPLQEAIRFIRESGATVVRPEILGLAGLESAPMIPPTRANAASTVDALFDALKAGDKAIARGLIVSAYLAGSSLAALFDGPMRFAIEKVGELWHHDERGILVEHRATAICVEIVAELRTLVPRVEETAPLALGGAPHGDPYNLPTMMAAAVLEEAGYRTINFGAHTPIALLADEALERKAKIVWLSLSSEQPASALRKEIRKLAETIAGHRAKVILGGRFAAESLPTTTRNVTLAGSMTELATFAREINVRKPAAKKQ